MSQVQITLPNEPEDKIKEVILVLKEKLEIKNIILLKGENNALIILRRMKTDVSYVLSELAKIGIGTEIGIIDLIPITATIPEIAQGKKREKESREEEVSERVSLEEIKKNIKESATPDLHYLIFITLAAFVAGCGLILDSATILIASMLLSPLMGPILAVSYGIVTKDHSILRNGIKGQSFGIIIGLVVGIGLGLLVLVASPGFTITREMQARTFPNMFDITVAICAGLAVGFCITRSISSSLVGVAIAVALMPPMVNVGIVLILFDFQLALGSGLLVMTNIAAINICAFIVFRLKKIRQTDATSLFWKGPEERIKPPTPVTVPVPEKQGRFQKIRHLFKRNSSE